VQAVDLNTGKQVWQHETHMPWSGATLATSGGLMFSGSTDGHFMAFDAKTGQGPVDQRAAQFRHHRRAHHVRG
jgi:alcohol dehydrogenase (cytochrome c)